VLWKSLIFPQDGQHYSAFPLQFLHSSRSWTSWPQRGLSGWRFSGAARVICCRFFGLQKFRESRVSDCLLLAVFAYSRMDREVVCGWFGVMGRADFCIRARWQSPRIWVGLVVGRDFQVAGCWSQGRLISREGVVS